MDGDSKVGRSRINKTVWLVAFVTVFLASAICSRAAPKIEYPTRTITLIIPVPPGGPGDLMGRAYAEALKGILPRPIEVVNKGGAAQIPATVQVINSKPDGYTLAFTNTFPITVQPLRNPDLPIKGPQDIKPIITGGTIPIIFAVGADQPWKTMKEVIDYSKANPGKIRVAHVGVGSEPYLHLLSLEKVAGVHMTDVPFDGAAPATTALLGGNVEAICYSMAAVRPHFKSGKMRVLGIFLDQRMSAFDPDIPTMKELGYNALTEGLTFIVAGQVGLPREIVDILYDALKKAQQTPSFQKFLNTSMIVTNDHGTDYWNAELPRQYKFYAGFLKEIGLTK
jgi:tripartite-type tricarboxylate transporter receptor subunit TctC